MVGKFLWMEGEGKNVVSKRERLFQTKLFAGGKSSVSYVSVSLGDGEGPGDRQTCWCR